jgi:hypothetical protein
MIGSTPGREPGLRLPPSRHPPVSPSNMVAWLRWTVVTTRPGRVVDR